MQCANEGVKLLVFAYHHDMMNGIQEQLWDDGVKFIRIDGTVAPSDRAVSKQILFCMEKYPGHDLDCDLN